MTAPRRSIARWRGRPCSEIDGSSTSSWCWPALCRCPTAACASARLSRRNPPRLSYSRPGKRFLFFEPPASLAFKEYELFGFLRLTPLSAFSHGKGESVGRKSKFVKCDAAHHPLVYRFMRAVVASELARCVVVSPNVDVRPCYVTFHRRRLRSLTLSWSRARMAKKLNL